MLDPVRAVFPIPSTTGNVTVTFGVLDVIVNDVPAVLADTDTNPEFAPWDCGVRKIRVFAPTDVLLTTAVPLDRVASPIRSSLS